MFRSRNLRWQGWAFETEDSSRTPPTFECGTKTDDWKKHGGESHFVDAGADLSVDSSASAQSAGRGLAGYLIAGIDTDRIPNAADVPGLGGSESDGDPGNPTVCNVMSVGGSGAGVARVGMSFESLGSG